MSLADDLVVRTPKFLIVDIETAPTMAFVWEQYKTNVIATERDWYMMSFAYKWFPDGPVEFVSLPDRKAWKPDSDDDGHIVKRLAKLFDEADVVMAYNGDGFDIPKTQARMLYHGIKPTSTFQSIDPLKIMKKHFKLYSNSLKEVARYLDLDTQKLGSVGFDTWRKCMAGDAKAWGRMEEYNRRDVEVLEEIYMELQPWVGRVRPNAGFSFAHFVEEGANVCPACGADGLKRSGVYRTAVSEFPEFKCKGCGNRPRGRYRLKQYGGGVKTK